MDPDHIRSFDEVGDWLSVHERLTELEGFKSLSRFHSLIDDADVKFWKCMHEERPGLGKFKTLELTDFGRRVAGDSPRWWVFAEESDVLGLWNDTKIVFSAAQALLRDSEKLERHAFDSYEHVVDEIGRFLELHEHELHALELFATRLAAENELAPSILFSYSVWGSTRRADRSLDGQGRPSERERLQMAGEMALGLRRRTWPVLYHAWLAAVGDAYEAASSEEEYLAVTVEELFRRTEYDIKRAFTEYCTQVRDSIRHIDLLCQEAKYREHIYADDEFLSMLLRKIRVEPTTIETDLWDLKETLDMWVCPNAKREAASVAFAEDVAAFANNRGGILIVGVTDDTHDIVGVRDTENRMKHIASVLRERIDTPADFVRVRAVRSDEATCIVVVVGQTATPVGVRQANNSYTYPIRVGPGLQRVSRSDIFGSKGHMKGTSFAFAEELASWVGL